MVVVDGQVELAQQLVREGERRVGGGAAGAEPDGALVELRVGYKGKSSVLHGV